MKLRKLLFQEFLPYVWKLVHTCGRQNNGPPKDDPIVILASVNLLLSVAKGTLQL